MRLFSLITLTLLCCVPLATVRAQKSETNKEDANLVSFTISFTITATPGSKLVKLDVLLPQTIAGRQKIVEIKYSLTPAKKFRRDGNSYAQFVIVKPKKTTEITISVDAEILRYDLSVASANEANRLFEKKKDLEKWLVHEKYLEKDAPEIKQIAKTLLGKTEEETVRNTIAFVGKTLRKGPFDGADHGAVWALQNKEGDCTEFADLFLALCRANSVPARYRNGYLIHDVPKEDTPKHDWAEVYIAKYGWVPFDPLHTTQRGIATVNTLRPVYVYLDNQRTNAVFGKYHYFGFTCQGEKVRIQDEFKLKSRKAFAPK